MTRQIQLKVFLVKKELTSFTDVLLPDGEGSDHSLAPLLEWDGLLRVRPSHPTIPDWTKVVAPILESDLPAIRTSSSGALLLLRVEGRIFAFTFGYGRSLMRPDSYERDFGLKVALNVVNPDALRSIDTKTIEEMTVSTRREASRATHLGTFALDSSQDLLRGVTGTPTDKDFGSRVSGSEGLTLATTLDIRDLPAKCRAILKAYQSKAYRSRFGFIDYLRIVRDPALRQRLDDVLVAAVNVGQVERLHLAPAEPENWEDITGFTYSSSRKARVYPDLAVDDVVEELKGKRPIDLGHLKSRWVGVRYREAMTSVDKYSLYSCIVFETEFDGKLYVLSGGDWHQVDKTWAGGVRARVAALARTAVALPPSWAGEKEDDYNARVAKAKGWALMDKKLVTLAPPHDRVEMCDLLTSTHQLIHVKRRTVSATLSHLFAQGRISGELLFRSDDFREECRKLARQADARWAKMIPRDKASAAACEIIYAILARSTADWPRSLPFFSQLNLANAANSLGELGYRVAVQHVPADPQ